MLNYYEPFEKMKVVGAYAAQCLQELKDVVVVNITTKDIEAFVKDFANKHSLVCAPYGYRGFPGYCCTSVNHVICHGIPSKKILKDGDKVSVDVTFIKDGYYGDACWTYLIGDNINPKLLKLIEATKQAMWAGVAAARPGNKIIDISRAIQTIAKHWKFGIVKDFVGHGIGQQFHIPPAIPNFVDKNVPDIYYDLIPGMMFTVEPMLTIGSPKYKRLKDGWAIVTRDRSWAAQFEVTIGITEDGHIIFT